MPETLMGRLVPGIGEIAGFGRLLDILQILSRLRRGKRLAQRVNLDGNVRNIRQGDVCKTKDGSAWIYVGSDGMTFNIEFTLKSDGIDDTDRKFVVQRSLLDDTEETFVKIDDEIQAEPDVDVSVGNRGLKLILRFDVEWEDEDGKEHVLKVRAKFRP